MVTDNFAHKSKTWDMNSKRVQNAKGIAEYIIQNIKLHSDMKIMDFGAGTGLLSYFVAPYVDTIVAVDNSPSMLQEFKNKSLDFDCKTEVLELDLTQNSIDEKFDGIISSMTIHHIEDIKTLFEKFYTVVEDGGFISIADLDSEDGSFHSDNTGVFHYGFERELLDKIAKDVGFKNIRFELASKINKPHANFSVFLMLADK
ncbi:MAG TPA: class I SAM-dependent methyltransferase [Campylobacterales bacterium]|nr:class I SAM-dependent methyltransferase [Campylobacterales bacterium]HHH54181.1 class I SAM-dependent methyltransferase [Bacteroidota bacterium]